ncbi:MAG TPA: DNA polymerase III subunit alpha, partial [Trueperaceae bacterium]|nr:DNA polymerase III subunit alpha [Trueperaceae bacterium]
PSALSNSMHIADMCDLELPIGKNRNYQMPELKVPEGRTLAEQLRVQSYQGMIDRYPDISEELFRAYLKTATGEEPKDFGQCLYLLAKHGETGLQEKKETENFPTYKYPHLDKFKELKLVSEDALVKLERVEYELSVILGMGFPDYFLIVADFINWAKAQKIAVGPGRGSGAGSIVAYALKITNIDPLVYNLLFERMLNPDRISMPDFDIDFSDVRRNEVIEYVRQKYGDEKVAHIATFGTMAAKAAIKDAARVLEAPYADADKVSKLIPVVFGRSTPIEQAIEEVPEIKQAYEGNAKEFMDVAMALEGLTRHASMHAAGVIIAKNPITDLAPVFKRGDGPIVCQYDMSSIEDLGLIKVDFLGLRTLSFIEAAVKIINETHGIELNPDDFPIDDEATYKLLSRGESAGVFQFESGGMVDSLKRLKPRRIQDLIALTSLYRPGPMDNIPTYIRRHHGLEKVQYDDFPDSGKLLEPILDETYGIPVYQEQIMQIARDVANYSLGEADILRRAMGKKKTEEMIKHRKIFSDGAAENGVKKSEADRLFDLLEKFANYGFNKSHAAAYSVLSFQTAYIKAHYPLEFTAALLTVERANSDKVAQYVNDAKQLGITVLAPDINVSRADFTPVDGVVRFGLYGIKNLGDVAVEHILEERKNGKFKDIWDFCKRIDTSTVNKRALEHLIKSGAFDALGQRHILLANFETAMKWGQAQRSQTALGQMGLFASTEVSTPKLIDAAEIDELELLQNEKTALGLYISSHPMNSYPGLAASATCSIHDLEDWYNEQKEEFAYSGRIKVAIAGILQNVSKKTTKRGNMYARFEIADETASREIMAFSRTYDEISDLLENDAPVVLIAELSDDEEQMRIVTHKLFRWDKKESLPQVVVLELDLEQLDPESLLDFRSQLDEVAGITPLRLELLTDSERISYQTKSMRIDKSRIEELQLSCPWLKHSIRIDIGKLLEPSKTEEPRYYSKQNSTPAVDVPF